MSGAAESMCRWSEKPPIMLAALEPMLRMQWLTSWDVIEKPPRCFSVWESAVACCSPSSGLAL